MEVMNSAYFPGVNDPSVIGFSDIELLTHIEVVCKKAIVRLVDISGYNPAVEETRSGKLLAMILNSLVCNL